MGFHDGPIDWPQWEEYSSLPMYNTKAVVQQTGVPAPTLRAWERRYELLSPERGENAYRLYSERDIATIRWLKERIDSGINISQAISLFHRLSSKEKQPTITPVESSSPVAPISTNGNHQQTAETEFVSETPITAWSSYPTSHNLRVMRDNLIDVFQNMDEQTAHVMMGSVLSLYSVEQVCNDLIVPTLWQIGQLWSEGKLTVSVEHFASNFFRALLTNRFHITPSPVTGPLVLVTCAPDEEHELASLMLALFLRLHHIRVIYLGQKIETNGLIHTIRQLRPVMVCISLTIPAFFDALVTLGTKIQHLPEPRPLFIFGGQAFIVDKSLDPDTIPGRYITGSIKEITTQIETMLRHR